MLFAKSNNDNLNCFDIIWLAYFKSKFVKLGCFNDPKSTNYFCHIYSNILPSLLNSAL